jgi:hypothetical protein
MRKLAAIVLLTTALSCSTFTSTTVSDRLYFGRAIPAGGMVSEAEWQAFVSDFVTPRLPKGFSIFEGNGQWQDPRGKIWREPGYVIEVHHTRGEDEAKIVEIAEEYKRRFHQDAVLRATSPATIHFY